MKTVNVKNAFDGSRGTTTAYADEDGRVLVYDSVAGHYTTCHSLTASQEKYVRARTAPKGNEKKA